MHMPMHVGDNHDRDGNDTQVRFFDRGTNMHRLWDSDIIDRVRKDEAAWVIDLSELDTEANRAKAMDGKVEDWATESLLAARAAYQVPGVDRRIKSGEKLGDAYFNASLPVVRERLYRGGCGWRWCSMTRSPRTDETERCAPTAHRRTGAAIAPSLKIPGVCPELIQNRPDVQGESFLS